MKNNLLSIINIFAMCLFSTNIHSQELIVDREGLDTLIDDWFDEIHFVLHDFFKVRCAWS